MDALDRAIAVFETQDKFATALGIKSPSISEWRKRGRIPHERCAEIERLTGGQVTRAELRPDIWGDPQDQKAA
jgi:DNA-binding transcriptional regulator YdaS (Cro superfamily)